MKQWIIGLTGPTGAGKSIVGGVFAQNGCAVIDTDRVARQVTQEDPGCLAALQAAFGADLVQNGVLNRQELARRAFSAPGGGQKLNSITHPRILARANAEIAACFAQGYDLAVLDAPLLFESGADQTCNRVVAVVAPAELRIARIMARDHITRQAAQLRLSAQQRDAFYTGRADYVLTNDGAPADLEDQAAKVLASIRREMEK